MQVQGGAMREEGRPDAQQAAWLAEFSIDQTIAAGLSDDIERIIYLAFDQFEKQEGPRFNLFTDIWHKSGLGEIFTGRESFREMFEFSEELLARVKRFALSSLQGKANHQLVRFAAIYMLYSLYFKQPCRPRAKVRLVAAELEDLRATAELARAEQHWDVTFAWCRLVTGHAFHYTAAAGWMGLEVAQQLEQREAGERSSQGARDDYFTSKEYTGLIRKLGKAHAKYTEMKSSLAPPSDRGLFLADSSFPTTVRKVAKRRRAPEVEEGTSSIGRKRRELKERAYGEEQVVERRKVENDEEDEWQLAPSTGQGRRGRGRGRGKGARGARGVGRGNKRSNSDPEDRVKESKPKKRRGRKRKMSEPGEGDEGASL